MSSLGALLQQESTDELYLMLACDAASGGQQLRAAEAQAARVEIAKRTGWVSKPRLHSLVELVRQGSLYELRNN